MPTVRAAVPAIVAASMVSVVTALLWLTKIEATGPQHPVFFYLLPIAWVAVLYGSRTAIACAVAAAACAAFFLYDPIYSFYVTKPVEMGELICFTGLAMIGAKCTADLLRPAIGLSRRRATTDDQEF